MPELPDVEGQRRFFDRHVAGHRVRSLSVDSSVVRNTNPQGLGRALGGSRFERAGRHGKWLLCRTDGPTLMLHFGMGGQLVLDEEPHPHDRLTLELDDHVVAYRNMRKFGGVWLAHDSDEENAVLGKLGPDALGLGKKEFVGMLERRRGSLKGALMDQSFTAGLGNLTVDESLWRARLHPRRQMRSLSDDERGVLHRSIQRVLRDSVREGLVPGKRTWLTGARRDEEPACPRCGSPLRRERVAGRTTYWCPKCQQL